MKRLFPLTFAGLLLIPVGGSARVLSVARPSVADPRPYPSQLHNPTTSVAEPPDPSQPRLSPQVKLARLERTVQRLRHLNQLRPVNVVFLVDRQFNQMYSSRAHKDTSERDIQVSQKELDLLGLLKPGQDLHRILFANLSAQIGGFYDDHVKELFVRNHANQVLGLRRDLIAHEYTHALQDQHYNLLALTPDLNRVTYRNSDAWAAHKALIEGDAVNTQYQFIFSTYTRSELGAFAHEQSTLPKTPTLPRAIQREFDFQYTIGLKFVQTLYSRGRTSGVDNGFARLPSSTYEIMHPGAYLRGWKPVSVALHRVQGFEQWSRLDDDVFGAFGYNLLLWQSLSRARADKVTDGWRGDRYVFLEKGHQDAMLFKSIWTNPRTAAAAGFAILASLRSEYSRLSVRHSVAVGRKSSVYIHATGPRLTVVYASSAGLARKMGTAPTS